MGWQPNYQSEAKIYAAHILETKPNAKIAVLYQNDDYGKDYLKGFEDGLADNAKAGIVAKVSYEVTDPTIDSQMVTLKASGADTFFNITTPKFAAQAIKKAADKAKEITRAIKAMALKVQATLQDRQIRVTGSKRDDLQKVIASLRGAEFGVGLAFKNFRD